MNRHYLNRVTTLVAMLGLAVMSLLLLFLLLGRSAVGATPEGAGIIPDVDSCVCSGVWVSETVNSAGYYVNSNVSLVLEPTYPYTPHIGYSINGLITTGTLKYARLRGTTWFSETVDPFADTGNRDSLALVPTYPYTPCISYSDRAEGWWGIRFACRNSITWTITVVYPPGHMAGQNGTSLALEPTYPYTPHISFHVPFGAYNLRHAYLSGTTWCSGTWVSEIVHDIPDGVVGTGNSIALESTYPYTPHISYEMKGGLMHAWKSGTTWLSETVDSVGVQTSLALDSSGNPRISYYNDVNRDLKYAWLSGTTWFSETVDSEGDVGRENSLALDSRGNPRISYYDVINKDLKLAHFDGTVWITQTVDSEGDVGPDSSLALDQAGCPHISYLDVTNHDLKYAYLPPVCKIYLPIITKDYSPT